ncbi:MAG: 2-succinyl-5-enolpyruvyl-6-hydroxy-3-cyclohexene-1-carboxylate synthase, partial [Actinomycetes bacterium]
SPYADWVDPGMSATLVVDAVDLPAAGGEWLDRWRAADRRLGAALRDLLARQPVLTGPAIAEAVCAGLDADDVLVAGSSQPIRDLDLAPIRPDSPVVYANRGLAGIDGTVSTALGVALASRRPTHALLGDLTLLHDMPGLLVAPGEPRPDLRLVVANDDGGSIFASLEHGAPERRDSFERLFGTPQGVDLAHLAAATGWAYRRAETAAAVGAALAAPPVGLELVEAVVDRAGRRALAEEIAALADLV